MNNPSNNSEDVSLLLKAVNVGHPGAETRLIELVYGELKRIAAANTAVNINNSISPSALVNEAWIKLFGNHDSPNWSGRGHFFSAAARAMRQILIDHARTKQRLKRGGERPAIDMDLSQLPNLQKASIQELLDLDSALRSLENEDNKLVELVELKFFGGHTTKQASELMGMSLRTANRNWQYAKARLWQFLSDGNDDETEK